MPNTSPAFHAVDDINPCRFVKLVTDDFGVDQAGSNEDIIGISQEGSAVAPIPGASTLAGSTTYPQLKVYGPGDVCLLELGSGGATRGLYLKSDADGKGVAIATSGTTAQNIGCKALQSGAEGEKIQVLIIPMYKVYPALA